MPTGDRAFAILKHERLISSDRGARGHEDAGSAGHEFHVLILLPPGKLRTHLLHHFDQHPPLNREFHRLNRLCIVSRRHYGERHNHKALSCA